MGTSKDTKADKTLFMAVFCFAFLYSYCTPHDTILDKPVYFVEELYDRLYFEEGLRLC